MIVATLGFAATALTVASFLAVLVERLVEHYFGPLAEAGPTFLAQLGQKDIVVRLPGAAELLVSGQRVENQAFRFPGKHIYCTQFHPELNRRTFLDRLRTYPSYVEEIGGMPYEQFTRAQCHESPHTEDLLLRFARQVAGVG